MFKIDVDIITESDNTLFDSVEELSRSDVFVGIPEDSSRGDSSLTNAKLLGILSEGVRSGHVDPYEQLGRYKKFQDNMGKGMVYRQALQLYFFEHGSELWRIPPRPVIEPAMDDPDNREILEEVIQVQLEHALDGWEVDLAAIGQVAAYIIKQWFYNPKNLWAENAPSTIRVKGSDRPLIDTDQLRQSITFRIGPAGTDADNIPSSV